jgi:hypothetical protein
MTKKKPVESRKWLPAIGNEVSLHLPQEIIRAEVVGYRDEDTMDVLLSIQPPLAKAHNYRYKQRVVAHRAPAQPSGERWKTEDAD